MKYLYTLLSLLILTQFNATAQRNFKPGYIIALNGDTTKGFVDYKEWNQNPKIISFKITEQAPIQQFSVSNAAGFGVYQLEEYKRYIGPISLNVVELQELINSKDTRTATDSVFFKVIAEGKYITLFKYTDYLKERFFVSEGKSSPFELKYYRYLDSKNTTVITEKTYGQQLQRLIITHRAGDIGLIQKTQAIEYKLKDLEKIVYAINGLEKAPPKTISDQTGTQFFIGLAAYASHINYKESYITSNTSVLPQLNAGLNVFLNNNVRKSFFRAEINLTGSTVDALFGSYNTVYGQSSSYRYTHSQLAISVSPQLFVNAYNTDNLKAFIGGGLAYSYNKTTNVKYHYGASQTNSPSYSQTFISLLVKAGVTIKRLEGYVGYSRPLSDFVESPTIRHSYQLGVNYFFR